MLLAKMPDGKPEIYSAFQGEGATMGELCVFVRAMGCNLQCKFCDTSYTWYFEGSPRKHKYSIPVDRQKFALKMSPEEVAQEIRKAAGPIRRVVFTGGEPLLQQPEIVKVIEELCRDGEYWAVEIETNGTIKMNEDLIPLLSNINCSPKMDNSGNAKEIREKIDVIEQFLEIDAYHDSLIVIFKFVVGVSTFKEDFKELRDWEKRNRIPRSLIYLMPEGIEVEDIVEGTKFLFDNACKKYGYHLSTRLQVILYGSQRAT